VLKVVDGMLRVLVEAVTGVVTAAVEAILTSSTVTLSVVGDSVAVVGKTVAVTLRGTVVSNFSSNILTS